MTRAERRRLWRQTWPTGTWQRMRAERRTKRLLWRESWRPGREDAAA